MNEQQQRVIRYKNEVLCETFFRFVGKFTHVLSLLYVYSQIILRAFSFSFSLVVIIAQRSHQRGHKNA